MCVQDGPSTVVEAVGTEKVLRLSFSCSFRLYSIRNSESEVSPVACLLEFVPGGFFTPIFKP